MRDMETLEALTDLRPRLFTVDEYHRLDETGIFDDERVELLDGVIVRMPGIGMSHWSAHYYVTKYLMRALGDVAQVHGQISLPLGDRNEPQPDLAILANLPYLERKRLPDPEEIYAMIELADSSIARDTRIKRRLYAQFNIRDYLIVDLVKGQLRHYGDPKAGDYASLRLMGLGEHFSIAALPAISLCSDEFLRGNAPGADAT
jgi:Uma2 family endonuclease